MTGEKKEKLSSERILTLSNIVSLFRAIMGIPIIISLKNNQMAAVTFFVVLAIVSDAVDGFLARKFNSVTVLGKAIDPIADKICILSIIIFLLLNNRIPLHFLVIVISRDLIVAMMHAYLFNIKSLISGAIFSGKISTVTITAALLTYIYNVEILKMPLTLIAYFFLFVSFVEYTIYFANNFGKRNSPPSPPL
jgi:CDP-diacylglycerol--glycerol-3-phosphate 3-phosphatidyltransferase